MKRLGLPALLLVALVSLGLLNWSTTCCCGRSMVLEFAEGGCDAGHDHDHLYHHAHDAAHSSEGHQHGHHDWHRCYKAGADWSTVEPVHDLLAAPDVGDPTLVAPATTPVATPIAGIITQERLARAGPSERQTYLRLQILLI